MWSIIILVTIGIIVAYDVWCYIKGNTTLSTKVVEWTVKYPLLPFIVGLIVGLLAGHWWWPKGCLPFIGVC